MPKLPGATKPFSDMTPVGKVTYIGTAVGVVFGAIFSLFQVVAFASDHLDERTVQLIESDKLIEARIVKVAGDNAWGAVNIKVSGGIKAIQKDIQRISTQQTIRFMKMERRMIGSEIRDITRSVESLNPEQQEDIEQLRDDRKVILEEIKDLEEELNTRTTDIPS
jgi:peptidoglycan hydrolase CwlO-like protein